MNPTFATIVLGIALVIPALPAGADALADRQLPLAGSIAGSGEVRVELTLGGGEANGTWWQEGVGRPIHLFGTYQDGRLELNDEEGSGLALRAGGADRFIGTVRGKGQRRSREVELRAAGGGVAFRVRRCKVDIPGTSYSNVDLVYLEPVGGIPPKALAALRKTLLAAFFGERSGTSDTPWYLNEYKAAGRGHGGAIPADPAAGIAAIVAGCRREVADSMKDGNQDPHIAIQRSMQVVHRTPSFLTVAIDRSEYHDGPHGDWHIEYVNVDLSTGRAIGYDTIFKRERREALILLIQAHIRLARLLKGEAPRSPGELPEQFYVAAGGVGFFYNVYEFGSYVDGFEDAFLPWSDLPASLFRKSSPVRPPRPGEPGSNR